MARPSHKKKTGKAPGKRRRAGAKRQPAARGPAVPPRALQALRESEERFRATFEQAAFGVAHTTTDGRILQANGRLCQMLGYAPAELLTLTTRELAHPDDRGKQHP